MTYIQRTHVKNYMQNIFEKWLNKNINMTEENWKEMKSNLHVKQKRIFVEGKETSPQK